MNSAGSHSHLPEQALRWFGPDDPVPLSYLRQAGAESVFTSLHQIPYGHPWPRRAIRQRKQQLAAAGLRWSVVESVPVHEDIKTGQGDLNGGDLKQLFENYNQTLRHLAAEGLTTVIYNFMPVLDWIRTDMNHILPDGSRCLLYDPVKFCAFETHALQRTGIEEDYTPEQIQAADLWWQTQDDPARSAFVQTIIDVFPGVKWGLQLDDIRAMLARYAHFSPRQGSQLRSAALEKNLIRFLHAVIPVAEAVGIRLAIHPDDPPFPVLGLPRIVSTQDQIRSLLRSVDSPMNGLCFCTGSLSARSDNDLPGMFREFAPRIHAVHLRSTQRLPDGRFHETDHLAGSVDMPAIMKELLNEQSRRRRQGRSDARLPFRPDHGQVMLDDLDKPIGITPGYTCIGRLRGLAELRGLMIGLSHAG